MAETKKKSASTARAVEQVEGIVTSIGPKLHRLRQEQRLSLQQLAVKANVAAATIHKIEHNGMVPTITTLLKIAAALEQSVNCFLEDEGSLPERVRLTVSDERPAIFTPHRGLALEGLSGHYANFRSAAAVAIVAPGANSGSKPLSHPGEELVFVTEGALVFEIEGTTYSVGQGDAVHFVGDQQHRWANKTKMPARAIWFVNRDR
ncbi:MAG: XRE family transcriptional regulator [Microbacteriaceae bacterium]